MRRVPRHLVGAPKLRYKTKGYYVKRSRGVGVGRLVYTYKCSTCGEEFHKVLRTSEDYSKVQPCSHRLVKRLEHLERYEAYKMALLATHKELVKTYVYISLDTKIVRPKDFVKFIAETIDRFGYIVDPSYIEVAETSSGFKRNNLEFHYPKADIWGDINELADYLKRK